MIKNVEICLNEQKVYELKSGNLSTEEESEYCLLYGEMDTAVIIPIIYFNNKIIYDFNNLIPLDITKLEKCDNCFKFGNKDDLDLYNLYPELNDELGDLKEEYIDYDGMICEDCLKTFKK